MKKYFLLLLILHGYTHSSAQRFSWSISTHVAWPSNPIAPSILSIITTFCLQGLDYDKDFELETNTLPYLRMFILKHGLKTAPLYAIRLSSNDQNPQKFINSNYSVFHQSPFFDLIELLAKGDSDDQSTKDFITMSPKSPELSLALLPARDWMTHQDLHKFSNIVHGIKPGLIRYTPEIRENGEIKSSKLVMQYSDTSEAITRSKCSKE